MADNPWHTEKFGRRICRDIKCFASDCLFSLFGTILPTRRSVFDFESFFDWRFHVIVAVAFVCSWHSGTVERPSCADVIAAAAVVVGIFDLRNACFVCLHRLRAGSVALDQNRVATLLC